MQFCAYFSKIRPEAEGGGHQWENVIRNLLHSTEMGQRESPLTKWPDEPEKSSYLQFRIKMGERKQKKSEEKMTILTLASENYQGLSEQWRIINTTSLMLGNI